MTDILKKIGYRGEERFMLLNCPVASSPEFADSHPGTDLSKGNDVSVGFVYNKAGIESMVNQLVLGTVSTGKIWVAYPKKSGSINTDISRDSGWGYLDRIGYRAVSIVSLDSDWSIIIRPSREVVRKAKSDYEKCPIELEDLLQKNPKAKDKYDSLSPSNKKEYNMWIIEAKRDITKKSRLDKTLEMLLEGKRNPHEE